MSISVVLEVFLTEPNTKTIIKNVEIIENNDLIIIDAILLKIAVP